MKQFFLWLSGHTSREGIEASTEHEIAVFCCLGCCVLIPCIQAFIASFYTLNSTFEIDLIFVIPLSLFFSFCILMIDRLLLTIQIPSHIDKESYSTFQRFLMTHQVNWTLRLFISIVLGLLLSTPMSLRLFQDHTYNFYIKSIEYQKSEVSKKYKDLLDSNKSERGEIRQDIHGVGRSPESENKNNSELDMLNSLQEDLKECYLRVRIEENGEGSRRDGYSGKVGCGPRCKSMKKECMQIDKRINEIQHIIDSKKQQEKEIWGVIGGTITGDINDRLESNQRDRKRLESERDNRLKELDDQKNDFGIITQWSALQGVIADEKKKNGSSFTNTAHIIIILALMLLDLIPISYKFCLPSSGYSRMIDKREEELQKLSYIDRYVDKKNLSSYCDEESMYENKKSKFQTIVGICNLHFDSLAKVFKIRNDIYEHIVQNAPKDRRQEFEEYARQEADRVLNYGTESLRREFTTMGREFTNKKYYHQEGGMDTQEHWI